MASMPRATSPQLNIRSRFARERASSLAAQTGLTVTQVVEEALRAFQPAVAKAPPGRLVRKDGVLVKPAGGQRVTLDEANAALEESRSELVR
jgi:hypothetical protein